MRTRSIVGIAVLLSTALLSGCGTVKNMMGRADTGPKPTPLEPIETSAPVITLWSRDVGAGSKDRSLKLVPSIAGGQIFVADEKGRVGAYDLDTGAPRWQAETKAPISGGPGAGEGLVLVGSRNAEVIALDEVTGAERWRARVTSEVLAAPRAARGVVVVRTLDGRLFGLNAQNGRRLWVYDRPVPVLTVRGTSAPVIAADAVLAGFDEGRLVAVTLADGRAVWEAQISTPRGRSDIERMVDIDAEPQVAGNTVFAVAYQGRLAALDLFSGRPLWSRELSSRIGLNVDGRHVYVTDDNAVVWAMDRNSGATVWRQPKLASRAVTAPGLIGEHVVVGDYEGYLHWLRRADGQFVARQQVDRAGLVAPPVVYGGTVYVFGASGSLSALRPAG